MLQVEDDLLQDEELEFVDSEFVQPQRQFDDDELAELDQELYSQRSYGDGIVHDIDLSQTPRVEID